MADIIQQFMQGIQGLSEQDFNTTTGLVFLGKFRTALLAHRFSVKHAEIIATSIEVELANGLFSEEQLSLLADAYAKMVVKLYDALEVHGFEDPVEALCRLAAKLSLKCS